MSPDDLIEYVTDRKGHDRRYAMDISRIREELDWEPQVSLEVGLARTVAAVSHAELIVPIFLDNYRRYRAGSKLSNVVDFDVGY